VKSVNSFFVHPDNDHFTAVDGILFNKQKTVLHRFPTLRKGTYTIPDGVVEIARNAFDSCFNLQHITIPESVTHIGGMAFAHCTSLETVIIPENVTDIGTLAFLGCSKLATVTFKGAKPKNKDDDSIFLRIPAQTISVPPDMGWTDGETFGGKPVKVR